MSTEPALGRLPGATSNLNNFSLAGLIYADKSDLLAELARRRGLFLLSRPRGFGKSMLLSSLTILFTQGREPFRRYLLYEHWEDGEYYPVAHVDCSSPRPGGESAPGRFLFTRLQTALQCLDLREDDDDEGRDPLLPLRRGTDLLAARGRSCVLLLEECDVPLMQALAAGSRPYAAAVSLYRELFELMEERREVLRFALATSTLSLGPLLGLGGGFEDLSLDPGFAQLLGFTPQEAGDYFEDYIRHFARTGHLTRAAAFAGLSENYGGYSFDGEARTELLHPASFLRCLRHPQQGFAPYWDSNRPVDALITRKYAPAGGRDALRQLEALTEELSTPRRMQALCGREVSALDELDDAALLYQAGYLAIREVRDGQFILGRANRQSDQALVKVLVG